MSVEYIDAFLLLEIGNKRKIIVRATNHVAMLKPGGSAETGMIWKLLVIYEHRHFIHLKGDKWYITNVYIYAHSEINVIISW